MEELQGRVVFDDCGPTPEIPLIVMGFHLVPGQTLPLTIFHPGKMTLEYNIHINELTLILIFIM